MSLKFDSIKHDINNMYLESVSDISDLLLFVFHAALDDNRTKTDFTHKNCTRIDYFDVDKYQPDPRDSTNDSTNVIPCEYIYIMIIL